MPKRSWLESDRRENLEISSVEQRAELPGELGSSALRTLHHQNSFARPYTNVPRCCRCCCPTSDDSHICAIRNLSIQRQRYIRRCCWLRASERLIQLIRPCNHLVRAQWNTPARLEATVIAENLYAVAVYLHMAEQEHDLGVVAYALSISDVRSTQLTLIAATYSSLYLERKGGGSSSVIQREQVP